MAEWSIALPWKGSNWVTGSGVRIPVSPPFELKNHYLESFVGAIYHYYMHNNYIKKIANILEMLHNLDSDLNLIGFNETEKKIYYSIASNIHNTGKCNISDVIESSALSRSTVYKAIKNFEDHKMVKLIQSNSDRREIYLKLAIN